MTSYSGPTQLPCVEKCDVPEGYFVTPVPAPRHNWADVLICPNEGCGWALLVGQHLAGGDQ